jgi:hypothetical protein
MGTYLLGIMRGKKNLKKNPIVVFTLDKALDKERFTRFGPRLSSTYVGPWPYFSKAHTTWGFTLLQHQTSKSVGRFSLFGTGG